MQVLKITATGNRAKGAQGAEIILLGYGPNGALELAEDLSAGGWEQIFDVRIGEGEMAARAWKAESAQSHPWSGIAQISLGKRTFEANLYGAETALLRFDSRTFTLKRATRLQAQELLFAVEQLPRQKKETKHIDVRAQTVDLRAALERAPASTAAARGALDMREDFAPYWTLLQSIDPFKPVALYVPRWKGVASSTLNLFPQHLPIPLTHEGHPDLVTEADSERYARMLLGIGAKHFVVSGGDTFFIDIIRRVQDADPSVRFDLLWHSNYLQMGETHDWRLWEAWLYAHREGWVRRIGVVKSGYDAFLRAHDIDAVFIPNIVDVDPDAITPSTNDRSAGIWLSGSTEYRKLPYASLFALSQTPQFSLKASGMTYLGSRLISDLDLRVEKIWSRPIPRAQLHKEMADTAVTLYVTISECSPMLPLESLGLGVPCLVGPSSHLFRRDAFLSRHLIVEDPLNAELIASKLTAAHENKAEIIDKYRAYAREERALAEAGVAALLN